MSVSEKNVESTSDTEEGESVGSPEKRAQPGPAAADGGRAWLKPAAWVRLVGGFRPCVVVMGLLTVALGWATILESTNGAAAAREAVYGAWWFVALNAWLCLALICTVLLLYPWRRRHAGVILIHAGLVVLIIGGFISFFGRIDGQITLTEGQTTSVLRGEGRRVEWLSHGDKKGRVPLEIAELSRKSDAFNLGGVAFDILERWGNSRPTRYCTNDGNQPRAAFELAIGVDRERKIWIDESDAHAVDAVLPGLRLRVLPPGSDYHPAPKSTPVGPSFVRQGQVFPMPAVGEMIVDGWVVQSIDRFKHAMVGPNGLAEGPPSRDNPAIMVHIAHGQDAVERHLAFEKFPEMHVGRAVRGERKSNLELHSGSQQAQSARLLIQPVDGGLRVIHEPVDGPPIDRRVDGTLPHDLKVGGQTVSILRHYDRAIWKQGWAPAPRAQENRPVLIVRARLDQETRDIQLAWNQPADFHIGSIQAHLRYGQTTVQLPFALRLEDFRQIRYPGTDMAMAYESDVQFEGDQGRWQPTTISMNRPLVWAGWKIYQSSFVGDTVSIFSAMKDPGLAPTYVGCLILCIGLVVAVFRYTQAPGQRGPVAPTRSGGQS